MVVYLLPLEGFPLPIDPRKSSLRKRLFWEGLNCYGSYIYKFANSYILSYFGI